ncbi:SHOCT domain-containing protein [Actinotignum urinale]|uniref:SHOCT domain-containing protein n=1 Tax=Actinotignum urinale TaxID=190146 RepID=UPI0003B6A6FF|nr:SHOCT domain-containing protein [Actinotignum urinale]MDY5159630.1 SHOCT domain-containing protein [Actinotignum urinale]
MSDETFRSELSFHLALSIAKTLLDKGVIDKREYLAFRKALLEKYQPVFGELLSR